jgi:hypothetical protein
MAPVSRLDSLRPSSSSPPAEIADDPFRIDNFEEELRRAAAVNEELLAGCQHSEDEPPLAVVADIDLLIQENAELRSRIEELEAISGGKAEELWQERQREYEALLEEKSEVIRTLHQELQQVQEEQESALGGSTSASVTTSGTKLGKAEEILRLKRELEEQRQQLAQDEEDMMAQLRQMELTMAKERAELARQRQEIQRLQDDLAREVDNVGRNSDLRDRLQALRPRTSGRG